MASNQINNRKDLLLLLLYSPGRGSGYNEPIAGRTRLVKMLFLFRREALPHFRSGTAITDENFYEFFPWKFGPFSQQVFDDLEFFRMRGFVEPTDTEEETLPESAAEWEQWLGTSGAVLDDPEFPEYSEQVFRLTPKGASFAEGMYSALTGQQRLLLREFKRRTSTAPLRALLKYVYEHYPEQTTQSEIKEHLLGS